MTSKQDELKQRLAAVLRDLQRDGGNDPEAVWLIGSLAATLVDKAKAKTWADLKAGMSQATYEGLVNDFQTQGNALWQAGKPKHTYAIQALSLSVVALTQRSDPVIRDGETLLDSMIEGAIGIYRKTQRTH
jgi:hypothetical protein